MYDFFAKLADPIGIVGVILLLLAYFGISTGRMSSNSLWYQVLNFLGACLILFSLCFNWNTPSVIIEIAWITISIIGVIRILARK